MGKSKNSFGFGVIPVIIMALLSLTALIDISKGELSIAGLSTIVGLIFFFLYKIRNKLSFSTVGLNGKDFLAGIKKLWLIILAPSILNLICVAISKMILPDYIDHVVGRTEVLLSFNTIMLMLIEFIIFAFIEEVSWRGFMQKQFCNYIKPVYAIFLTSIFFSIGHTAKGDLAIVVYDVFFVFCNSIFYGLAYEKSKNVFISTLSHFLANFTGLLILLWFK